MDKVSAALGFEFVDFDDLVNTLSEATDDKMYNVPGFDGAMHYEDPSGARLTAFQYEGEWASLPGFRSDSTVDSTVYRVTPYIAMVELRRAQDGAVFNQFGAASDEACALPGANPAGGEKLRADQLRIAAVGVDYELYKDVEEWKASPDGYDVEFPSELYSPSTERYYKDLRPSGVVPYVRLGGVIRGVDKRTNQLTDQDFYVCAIATPAGNLPLIIGADDVEEKGEPAEGMVFHGSACMLAAAGFWDAQLNKQL